MDRKGSAEWKGRIKDGEGTVSSESGVLSNVNYSFAKRFGDEAGTNPEELLAAAHAACFSMAASGQFSEMGHTPDYIRTTATATLEKTDVGFGITKVHLKTHAKVPGVDQAAFDQALNNAKLGCPVSKLFKGAEITLEAMMD